MQLFENLEYEGATKNKHQNIEKIAFKVVKIKFLARHITNQSLYKFVVDNLQKS